jgi:hypothetical protein
LNTKSLYFPVHRQYDPNHWVSDKTFVGMIGNGDKGWTKTSIVEKNEPYI